MVTQDPTVLDSYKIGLATVKILNEGGRCRYIVEEPRLTKRQESIVDKIIVEERDLSKLSKQRVKKIVAKEFGKEDVDEEEIEELFYALRKRLTYGDITVLLDDPNVEEIECRGPGYPITVVLRKSYPKCTRFFTNIVLNTEEEVRKVIEKLALRSDKPINLMKPYLEFTLPEGHRVAATVSREISIPGSTFDIRKFPKDNIALFDVIRNETISPLLMAFLWYAIEFKPFIMILGYPGAGKTTLLNALLTLVNPDYKVLTIEDTPEIVIPNPHWVRFVVRQSLEKSADVTMMDLTRLALRYRPDYLVIGEVRGKEIEALVHAAASGHGAFTTFHASNPRDVLVRVNTLLDPDIARLFLSTITMFVVVSRVRVSDKITRKVMSIYEKKEEGGDVKFERTFYFDPQTNSFNVNDIDTLIDKSLFIKNLMSTGYSIDTIKREIAQRQEFIKSIVDSNVDKNNILDMLYNFYGASQ